MVIFMDKEKIKIKIVFNAEGNLESVFTNLKDEYNVEVEKIYKRGKTAYECIDFDTEMRQKYREI